MTQSSTLSRLSALNTNIVADALNKLELKGAVYGLRPLWNCPNIVGRATTVKVSLKPDVHPTTDSAPSTLAEATTDGRILLISGGIDGVSCSDAIIEKAWKSKSVIGIIIDGMCQDVHSAHNEPCPIYGCGVTAISENSHTMGAVFGVPLVMRGVTVHQDDYVTADNFGTICIPAKHIEQVLDIAEEIGRRQNLIVQAIQDGLPPSEVMDGPKFEAIPKGAQSQAVAVSSNSNPKKATAEDQELVELFADLDTAAVSDALDKLGICGQARGLMPLEKYAKVTVGPAFTVRYIPVGRPAGTVGDFIDEVAEGDFVVIDNGGRTDCTVWGDIMTQYAGLRGIAGSVIDGVCRDVIRAIDDHYPLFTVGHWMRTGKDRVEVGAVNESIGVGGVHVKPRDIVVADANGVVFVPREHAREVADIARWIEKSEAGIREMILNGATLAKAREVFKYSQLQRTE